MREHGIKDNQALQLYFSSRVQPIVTGHGKKVIGWDEVLAPGLSKDTMVQSWRGQKSLAEAARLGHSGILSAGYYLDLMQPASFHYAADPLDKESASLNAEEKARILGGESCLWAEYVAPENVDMKIWPRNAAIAERLWSPQEVTDVASMYRRLAAVSRQLDLLGVRHEEAHRRMLVRLAGNRSIAALVALSGVLEPVKEYSREEMGQYTSFTPLNRLVDATRPESEVARELGALVDRALAGGAGAESSREELRHWFAHWKANDAALEPILKDSFLLQEAIPLSKDLAAVGAVGLEALDYLAGGRKPEESWIARQRGFLEGAAKPRAEMLLMIVGPVRKLVEAAGGQ
jgi:hexosaminidase